MTLISIVIALILEQLHALPMRRMVLGPLARGAALLEDKFNDGGRIMAPSPGGWVLRCLQP